jgi:hypothetical protein
VAKTSPAGSLFTELRIRRILGSSQYQATPLRPATLRIVPEKRIGRIGAPLATIEARLCYRPLDLLRSNFPKDFYFSVRVPLCTNVVDKQALTIS